MLLCNNIKCFKIYKIEKLKVFNVIIDGYCKID